MAIWRGVWGKNGLEAAPVLEFDRALTPQAVSNERPTKQDQLRPICPFLPLCDACQQALIGNMQTFVQAFNHTQAQWALAAQHFGYASTGADVCFQIA